MLNFYYFKMTLLENDDHENFLLFFRNFNTTLAASGTLEAGTKYQYLRTLVCGEVLCKFDSLCADV